MKIYIGKNSGFCFGVKRAVETAFSLKNSNTYILGEIIHNETVCNKLKESGITKAVEASRDSMITSAKRYIVPAFSTLQDYDEYFHD